MDKSTRNAIERATQRARKLLEGDFAAQLEGDFDVCGDGTMAAKGGSHLSARQAFQRERVVASIEHKRSAGMSAADSVADYLRDSAFTTLNRFVALKMLEARVLVQECITKGEQSAGYREFCGMAPGLPLLPESAGYRLYIEALFDELSTEVKVLFDRRDPSSVLWPKRTTFERLLEILNDPELASVWGEDETIGWVYQFFNGQDERRQMREESQAPRNSRELAIRNQFFTPRYVVQFLTDNTLGRIWYEMRCTKTDLAKRCEYMVRKADEKFVPRTKKDPRDLRVLDPACGSGHFLLYAFDLLVTIYEEAHTDLNGPRSDATGHSLAEDYPSLDALRRELPRLILAHNLHGVDIDPRCAQIAQLALWMRAQKAYRDFGIGRAERPQIRRSNIVVAEPLVADDQIAKEFVAKLGDAELGSVFTTLVEALNIAGDMGLLLRVETLVARKTKHGQTGDLFAPPEERIRAVLAQFLSDQSGQTNMRRRLFADDAAHGVALLGIAEKRFDVVLMNPPFGDGSAKVKMDFEKAYPRTKNDVYAAFVERGIEMLASRGVLGAITSRTGFFLTTFQKWREEVILATAPPIVFADLGLGVMDAALVEAAAYCLERSGTARHSRTAFLRVLEELDDKRSALEAAITHPDVPGTHKRFEVDASTFASIPGSPFAYWISDSIRSLYRTTPPFEGEGREARQGLATGDDFRFVRLWWEVQARRDKWVPYAKGGRYSTFYFDPQLVVNWQHGGLEITTLLKPGSNRPASRPQNIGYFFRMGLTWPRRTKSELSFRVMPSGCVFGDKGPAAFVKGDDPEGLLSLLAVASSQPFRSLIEVQLAAADAKAGGAARSYEVGVIQRTPVATMKPELRTRLASNATSAWIVKRTADSTNETSHAFLLPAVVNEMVKQFERRTIERELESIQKDIDNETYVLYQIQPEDRAAIEQSFTRTGPSDCLVESEIVTEDETDDESEDDSSLVGTDDQALKTWLVGCAFGRFDPRLVTGDRPLPPETLPFAPLPSRSPGMTLEEDEPILRTDILVDDEGHRDDLVARCRAIGERVQVGAPENLRTWLAKDFFSLHIRMYSESRRKAPIYWQLATASARYSIWLYIHEFSKDTLFRVQNDYAAPKLAHEERRLDSLKIELGEGGTAAQRKELTAQEALVDELRVFLAEVKRIAPLWNPNLDDGVIINFAPLWRLIPQNKSWQKELRTTWNSLCDGEYDWAHLAMHLWPERVVPKCAKDRSLAIAHGLEEVFWVEDAEGKWTARKTPTRTIEELVLERTYPAVKAALKSLLEAPAATGNGGRGRGRRVAVATERGDV